MVIALFRKRNNSQEMSFEGTLWIMADGVAAVIIPCKMEIVNKTQPLRNCNGSRTSEPNRIEFSRYTGLVWLTWHVNDVCMNFGKCKYMFVFGKWGCGGGCTSHDTKPRQASRVYEIATIWRRRRRRQHQMFRLRIRNVHTTWWRVVFLSFTFVCSFACLCTYMKFIFMNNFPENENEFYLWSLEMERIIRFEE